MASVQLRLRLAPQDALGTRRMPRPVRGFLKGLESANVDFMGPPAVFPSLLTSWKETWKERSRLQASPARTRCTGKRHIGT